MLTAILFISCVSLILLLYVCYYYRSLRKVNVDFEIMKFISDKIARGADTFLKCLYTHLIFFLLLASILILLISCSNIGSRYIDRFGFLYFIFGSLISILAGFIGMKISTKSNILTAEGAKRSLRDGFNVAFNSGSLIGVSIVFLGILGVSLIYLYYYLFCPSFGCFFKTNIILFALGVESVALFCRVAGGIFTKSADIGADLVGKLEKNIPEDDIKNPAVIADNVGDNVGDIAGMGSDLLGSLVSAIIGCVFSFIIFFNNIDLYTFSNLIMFPLIFCFCSFISSFILNKVFLVLSNIDVRSVFKYTSVFTFILNSIIAFIVAKVILPCYTRFANGGSMFYDTCFNIKVFYCVFIGLFVSFIVGVVTRYFTDNKYLPVKDLLKNSKGGASTNVLGGICLGYESTVVPIILYSIASIVAYNILGFCGISLIAIGVISNAMNDLSIDSFGPISDNAGGIVEMSKCGDDIRENTDVLDSLGNTTAATGKGFTITSSVFVFMSLFTAFISFLGNSFNISDIYVIFGLIIGAMIPYLFSAIVIKSVNVSALDIVNEVRSQFDGVDAGNIENMNPDYDKCIRISTTSAIKGMILPSVLIILCPIVVTLLFGSNMLIGLLVGILLSSILLGISQSNSGGAWDNAKKSFEHGVIIEGENYTKKSDIYKSVVVGDTIGDPLKDTSGPSMNIILKLTILISIVIVPFIFSSFYGCNNYNNLNNRNVNKKINIDDYEDDIHNLNNRYFNYTDTFINDFFENLYDNFSVADNSKYLIDLDDNNIGKPVVYENKDKYGNYEKLTKYNNGYKYESFYKK